MSIVFCSKIISAEEKRNEKIIKMGVARRIPRKIDQTLVFLDLFEPEGESGRPEEALKRGNFSILKDNRKKLLM